MSFVITLTTDNVIVFGAGYGGFYQYPSQGQPGQPWCDPVTGQWYYPDQVHVT